MQHMVFPVIDLAATGANILRLRRERGLSVRQLQSYFGFEEPRAIYKWQQGQCLPTVDNLYALGAILNVPLEQILVPTQPQPQMMKNEQQASACCSAVIMSRLLWLRRQARVARVIFRIRRRTPEQRTAQRCA